LGKPSVKSAICSLRFRLSVTDGWLGGGGAIMTQPNSHLLVNIAHSQNFHELARPVRESPGYPEVSDRNATFKGLKASGAFAAGAENAKIHPAVAPLSEEIVVTKHRVSAFAGTDLDLMLRANGIETLILTGIATSGVVLSTLRHAADADYNCWSSAIAALTATRKCIGCCWRRFFRARLPSRRLRDLSRLSGLGGRRVTAHASLCAADPARGIGRYRRLASQLRALMGAGSNGHREMRVRRAFAAR
jgi:Isochorismatase family